MLVSALLTSVGINLALCLLFFTLYSVLKKQPSNVRVYSPRSLAAKGASEESNGFNFERLLPTAGWLRRAWQPSEDEFLSVTSLDAVVFMRIFIFRLFESVWVCWDCWGFGSASDKFSGGPADPGFGYFGFAQYVIGLLQYFECECRLEMVMGSLLCSIHCHRICLLSPLLCKFCFEYSYISSKRIAHFYSSKPQPNQFTVVVRSVPVSSGSSCSETVESFFTENYPSTYLSHSVVRRTNKLQGLTSKAGKLYRKLMRLRTETNTQQRLRRDGCWGLFGRKVDALDYYGKKLDDLEDNVRMEQTSVAGKFLNVYEPKYETGGRFWPTVHNSTIFSLVLMHIIAIGMFGLKEIPLAAGLIIPLPILTLLFNEYCRKRFLPIFQDYPAECLIKKDREDEKDPTISAFYEKLTTAYRDPALLPMQHPRSTDGYRSPLLQSVV
ncbi:CSC1-like protein HYP1 [Pyrus ussuriensis x Pyrus communis]|uniref:CSC1-like protein HYP1 n=1 Tax=Pyrus ussuriensis x Pyrus communis TaxID=2448454 RepID=A0A5N5GHQ7_9ROSA|nr:CSC1-like protein HYP1 [Pyrus ussuriensis x Pyrus communis]